MGLATAVSSAHQARVLEDSQMFRYGGLGDTRVVSQHPHRLLTVTAQTLEEGATGRVGKGFKHGIRHCLHKEPITVWL